MIVAISSSVRLVESAGTMMDEMWVMIRAKRLKKPAQLPMITLLVILLPLSLLFSACNPIQAVPGYSLSLFVSGDASHQNPDGIAVDQGHVFIDYTNDTKKDGS